MNIYDLVTKWNTICILSLKYLFFFIYSFILNKKLISFINDMCMKMFFTLVNNVEKSAIFFEKSKCLYLRKLYQIILF